MPHRLPQRDGRLPRNNSAEGARRRLVKEERESRLAQPRDRRGRGGDTVQYRRATVAPYCARGYGGRVGARDDLYRDQSPGPMKDPEVGRSGEQGPTGAVEVEFLRDFRSPLLNRVAGAYGRVVPSLTSLLPGGTVRRRTSAKERTRDETKGERFRLDERPRKVARIRDLASSGLTVSALPRRCISRIIVIARCHCITTYLRFRRRSSH